MSPLPVTVRIPGRTARLSEHARQRCREMALRTKPGRPVRPRQTTHSDRGNPRRIRRPVGLG